MNKVAHRLRVLLERVKAFSVILCGKQFDEALDHYQKAIKLNESKPESYYNMGNAYSKLGSYQEAVDVYKKALEIDPSKD